MQEESPMDKMRRLAGISQTGWKLAEAAIGAIDKYIERLKTAATPEDKAGHLHMLKAIAEVEKALKGLVHNLPSREVQAEYEAALPPYRAVLNRLSLPYVLVKVSTKEDPLYLPDDK